MEQNNVILRINKPHGDPVFPASNEHESPWFSVTMFMDLDAAFQQTLQVSIVVKDVSFTESTSNVKSYIILTRH